MNTSVAPIVIVAYAMDEHLCRPNRHCGSRRLLAISPHTDHYQPLDSYTGSTNPKKLHLNYLDHQGFRGLVKSKFKVHLGVVKYILVDRLKRQERLKICFSRQVISYCKIRS